jgi:hypothetical protein
MGNNMESLDSLLEPSVRGLVHRSLLDSFSALQSSLHQLSNVDNDIPYKITEGIAMLYKFHVHSFLFMPDTYPVDMDTVAISLFTVAIPLFLVAVKSVSLLTYIMSRSRNRGAIPSFVLRYTTAVTSILYALTLCPCGNLQDVDGCKKGVADLYQVMSNPDSFVAKRCVRALGILEDMVNNRILRDKPLFNVKSRMGASATYSVISRVNANLNRQGKSDPPNLNEDTMKTTNGQTVGNVNANKTNEIIPEFRFTDLSILDDFWSFDPGDFT